MIFDKDSEERLCDRCKEDDPYNCYGGALLTPKPGFARFSLDSFVFLPCPNREACVGDPFYAKDNEYRSNKYWTKAAGMGLCKRGYFGVLCSECEENFGVEENFSCASCDNGSYFLGLLTKIFLRSLILYASISTALSINHSFEDKRSIETYVAKMNFFLKSLINHFQVLMMMYALPFYLPDNFRQVVSIVIRASAPDIGDSFSFECILKKFNLNVRYQYFRLISMFFFNLVTFAIFLLFEYLRVIKKIKREKGQNKNFFESFLKKYAVNLILLIISTTFIDQIKPAVELIACVDVGDPARGIRSKRLITQLSIDCESAGHKRWALLLGLPRTLLIGIFFPALVISRLYTKKREKTLYSKEVVAKYGCLFYGYMPSKYYYEFIVLLRKFCFLIVHVFFFSYPGNSKYFSYVNASLLLLLVIIFFYHLQLYFDPYNKQFFLSVHQCDNLSFLVLILTVFMGVFWLTRGDDITQEEALCLVLAAGAVNLAFFIYWTWNFSKFFFIEVNKFLAYTKSKLKKKINQSTVI